MAVLKKSSAPSYHWYTREGKPLHRMPLADGTGDRPTDFSDAKRLGLVPSVSEIKSILGKPGLEKWKIKQVALASMRLTRKGEETESYFADRIIEEAFKQVDDAANLGTSIHREIERFFTHDWNKPFEPDPKLAVYVSPVVNWMISKDIHVENPEAIVVNMAHGYAGTSDCPFRWKKGAGIGVIDYKSRKTKPGEPCEPYDGEAMQIAAYAAAYWKEENLRCCWGANVYISTTEPGRVDLVMYRPEMLVAEFEVFKLCCAIWRHLHQWDPRVDINTPQPKFHVGSWQAVSQPVPNVSLPDSAKPALSKVADTDVTQVLNRDDIIKIVAAEKSLAGTKAAVSPTPVTNAPGVSPGIPTILELLEGAKLEHICDGMEFLSPKDCCSLAKKPSIKTDYAWWYHAETNVGRVGLRGDAALPVHGWKNAFLAFPKDLDNLDRAAGKKPPVPTAANGLPPKPEGVSQKVIQFPDGGTMKTTKVEKTDKVGFPKKQDKITSAARLDQLESMEIPFGKHKGKVLREVDDSYLVWMAGQPQILAKYPAIKEYLERHDVRKALKIN